MTAAGRAAPAVSVVMAARNAEPFLAEAIGSLQRQTMPAFEAIVVDDGSSDATGAMLHALAAQDPRFRVLANDRSIGLAASLNRAIDAASAPLLARFDADDIAAPERFAIQVRAFDADARLVLLGSNVDYVDTAGCFIERSDLPRDDWTIRCTSLLFNPFAHPTVMMRRGPFQAGTLRYDPDFETTQDWELWTRLMDHGSAANLAQPLVQMRLSPGSVSATRKPEQLRNSIRIQQRYMHRLLGACDCTEADFTLLAKGFLGDRAGADREGWDRVRACGLALDILDRAAAVLHPGQLSGFRRYVVDRAVRMGIAPPMMPGWPRLFARLLRQAPVTTSRGIIRYALANAGRRG